MYNPLRRGPKKGLKRGIKILLMSDFFAAFAVGMIGPIYAIYVERIGGDILDASWAYFAFMISCGVVLYLMGLFENGVKNKGFFIVLGYVLTSLGCLSYIFVATQWHLIITQIILGLGQAVLSPVFDSLYGDYVNEDSESKEWAYWESMLYIANAVAALIGGYFAKSFGFKALFIMMFIISLFGVFASIGMLKKKKDLNKC
ncbi:MAG: MFS transporter [Patescibacteria group bacterium]|nr:MFS transporter [Patescibacteria group bacterium]